MIKNTEVYKPAEVRVFVKTMRADMAVLKPNLSMSYVTFLIVLCISLSSERERDLSGEE